MTSVEQSAEYGRQAARALHKNRDQALCKRYTEYQSRYVTNLPAEQRAAAVLAFNEAYREESAAYINARSMSR